MEGAYYGHHESNICSLQLLRENSQQLLLQNQICKRQSPRESGTGLGETIDTMGT
jgi:hypothetical protein